MTQDIVALIDAAIEQELRVSEVYKKYSELFNEDTEFWWKLFIEEQNHAALLRAGREYFLPVGKFPFNIVAADIDELEKENRYLHDLVEEYETNPPLSRLDALKKGVELEDLSNERIYQEFMEELSPQTREHELFQKLNREEKNHKIRIEQYIREIFSS